MYCYPVPLKAFWAMVIKYHVSIYIVVNCNAPIDQFVGTPNNFVYFILILYESYMSHIVDRISNSLQAASMIFIILATWAYKPLAPENSEEINDTTENTEL